jgi:hypothetical protein
MPNWLLLPRRRKGMNQSFDFARVEILTKEKDNAATPGRQ